MPHKSENHNKKESSKAHSFGEGLREVDLNCDMGEGMSNDCTYYAFYQLR